MHMGNMILLISKFQNYLHSFSVAMIDPAEMIGAAMTAGATIVVRVLIFRVFVFSYVSWHFVPFFFVNVFLSLTYSPFFRCSLYYTEECPPHLKSHQGVEFFLWAEQPILKNIELAIIWTSSFLVYHNKWNLKMHFYCFFYAVFELILRRDRD